MILFKKLKPLKNSIPMKKLLFNPFEFIAGFKALIIGVVAILISALLDYYCEQHMAMKNNWNLIESISWRLAGWFLFSVLLFLIGILFSKSKVRFIDVLGTQALARYPNIFASLISLIPSFRKFINHIFYKTFQKGSPVELSTLEVISSLFIYLILFLTLVWSLVLMFNAFKVSTNLKGEKSVWIFVVALVFSLITAMGVKMFLI